MKRHRARRLALQGLCCLDVQGTKVLDLILEFIHDSKETPETQRAARELMDATFADRQSIDHMLAKHARHWDLPRLALVDRNILRLAAHELRTQSAPRRVVVSEALKLAQEFSSAEASRFVNGILDAVAKELADDA